MTDNPYQPPEADVRDTPPRRHGITRPRQIIQAIALLWVSSGLGLASGLLEASRQTADSEDAAVVMVITTLVLLGVLTVTLWQGRNWARLTYVILVGISLSSLIASWGTVERPGVEVALEAVSFVADAGSFFLMFTNPGSLWFGSADPGSPSA